MTERELRAAAVGIMVYKQIEQSGGGEFTRDEDGDLEIEADLIAEWMERAMEVCEGIEIGQGLMVTMEAL